MSKFILNDEIGNINNKSKTIKIVEQDAICQLDNKIMIAFQIIYMEKQKEKWGNE